MANLPAALSRVGITQMTDNLPAGAGINFAKDAVRIFRADIERALALRAANKAAAGESPLSPLDQSAAGAGRAGR